MQDTANYISVKIIDTFCASSFLNYAPVLAATD